ncbi:MAG: proprotein convertase P-domain-containing protein [Deltaproteobacteria bacterium]|nr:proprotein convertase P-domain-containing protein [Deltaproteobacteria bacterium]
MRSWAPLAVVLAFVAACASGESRNAKACTDTTECPAATTTCVTPMCTDGACASVMTAAGTPCTDDGGKVCDGAGACVECADVARDCPAAASECEEPACTAGHCMTNPVAANTPTPSGQTPGDCKLVVCDGAGATMTINDNDPLDDHNDCTADMCSAGSNAPMNVAAGTPCTTNGGTVCGSGTKVGTCVGCLSNAQCTGNAVCDTRNDNDTCVSPSCTDMQKDGNETGVDCGGSCSPCGNGGGCTIGGDCTSGYCTGMTCTACTLDTQCPGTSYCNVQTGTCVPDDGNGTACSAGGHCTSGNCVDGVCCDLACNGLCEACTAAKKGTGANGTCGPIGSGRDPDNECAGTYACTGALACQSCTDTTKDGSETDVDCGGGGTCNKCPLNDTCSTGSDCLSNMCSSGHCVSSICGDGAITGSEQCDDSNMNNGDGCSSACVCEASRTVAVGPGLNLAIPDNAYAGTLATMACTNIVVSPVNGCSQAITSVSVVLGMDHTWIGDLVIKLVSPAGTTVTLMSRPGFAETADDGTGGPGTNADLVKAAPITFLQAATTSAENMGTSGLVVCQGDGVCQYAPNNGAAPAGNLTSFNGQAAAGTWRLCVGDAEVADTGSIDQVKLNFGY